MADKPSLSDRLGASPAKLALVAGLAVVLLLVLCVQFWPSSDPAPSSAAQRATTAPAQASLNQADSTSNPAAPAAVQELGGATLPKWRRTDLASVTRYDPFALPAAFPQPAPIEGDQTLVDVDNWAATQALAQSDVLDQRVQQMRADLEALRNLGVQVVIRHDDNYIAMIGDRTIQVGDEIDGFKVISIDSGGVHVARNLSP